MTHNAEAVCTCGDTWIVEVDRTDQQSMDARVACMFAVERGEQVRRYNAHVKEKHKKGRP